MKILLLALFMLPAYGQSNRKGFPQLGNSSLHSDRPRPQLTLPPLRPSTSQPMVGSPASAPSPETMVVGAGGFPSPKKGQSGLPGSQQIMRVYGRISQILEDNTVIISGEWKSGDLSCPNDVDWGGGIIMNDALMIVGIDTSNLVDGSIIGRVVYPAGTVSVQTVTDVTKTIYRYSANLDLAVKLNDPARARAAAIANANAQSPVAQPFVADPAATEPTENDQNVLASFSKPQRGLVGKTGVDVLRISGEVSQILPDNSVIVASGWNSNTLEPYTDAKGTPHDGGFVIDQPLLVIGVNTASLADGAAIEGVVFPAGTQSYETTDGTQKTIYRYSLNPQLAAKLRSQK